MRVVFYATFLMLPPAVLLSGCEKSQESGSIDRNAPKGLVQDGETGSPGQSAVTLKVVDKAGFDEVLGRHQGYVVLVDFWATWCAPCREGFPHTVEMSKQYAADGLKVVSLAVEEKPQEATVVDRTDDKESALEFLQEQEATFDNLVAENYETAYEEFELTALPEYRIYDRDGNLVKRFSAADRVLPETAWDHEDLEAAVREALGLPPTADAGDADGESPKE